MEVFIIEWQRDIRQLFSPKHLSLSQQIYFSPSFALSHELIHINPGIRVLNNSADIFLYTHKTGVRINIAYLYACVCVCFWLCRRAGCVSCCAGRRTPAPRTEHCGRTSAWSAVFSACLRRNETPYTSRRAATRQHSSTAPTGSACSAMTAHWWGREDTIAEKDNTITSAHKQIYWYLDIAWGKIHFLLLLDTRFVTRYRMNGLEFHKSAPQELKDK